jgi:predicted nucleic-acid-binding protein
MNITADTNVLLRAYLGDDDLQRAAATAALADADLVAISMQTVCEFAWVLERAYKIPREDAAAAIRSLLEIENVVIDRPAVEAGLALLLAGGDFADGVVAYEGRWLGGEVFVSFDRKAVKLVSEQGHAAQLLPQ